MIIGHIEGQLALSERHGTIVACRSVTWFSTRLLMGSIRRRWNGLLPTLAEIAAINAGAPVILRILGTVHPPVAVEVGKVPELVSFIGC